MYSTCYAIYEFQLIIYNFALFKHVVPVTVNFFVVEMSKLKYAYVILVKNRLLTICFLYLLMLTLNNYNRETLE